MIQVPDPKELVEKIKKVQAKQGLSINDMNRIMKEKYNYKLGTSTISRLLSGATDADCFNYLHTLIPLYNAIVVDDEPNESNKIEDMQVLLAYKMECIESLESQLKNKDSEYKEEIDRFKMEYLEKMNKETENFQMIMDFRNNQIQLKDDRITQLMNDNSKLIDHIVNCPYKGKCE